MKLNADTSTTSQEWKAEYADLLRRFIDHPAAELVTAARALGRRLASDVSRGEELAEFHTAWLAGDAGVVTADILKQACPLLAAIVDGHAEAQAKRRLAAFEPPAGTQGSSQSWFRSLWAAPIAMFLLGRDGACLYINPSLAELLDAQPTDCLGTNWLNLFALRERTQLQAGLQQAQRHGREFALELPLGRSNGDTEWIAIRTAPLLTASGSEYLRVGTAERITERKQAERVLRDSEAKFRTLAETVPAAIFIYRGTKYLYVNGMLERLTGFTRDELIAMPIWEIVHPEFRELARTRARQRQAGQPVPARYEFKLQRKDGSSVWIDFSASVIDFGGQPAVMGAALDISARKAAEAIAQERQAELLHVARVSTMGQMSSEIAHELNQPLAAIVNYANGCYRRTDDDPQHPAADLLPAIDEMRREAERAGQIIKRMRDFVRKQPSRQELSDINTLAREAVDLALAASRDTAAQIDYELELALPSVFVDRIQIIQVLVNLVRNGLDAMRALPPLARRMQIKTFVEGAETVGVSVADSGPGLDAEANQQLFDAFFTTKSEGLGLGLSISRSIVEAHAGRMWACNDPHGGAIFSFTLPTLRQERSA